MTHAQEQSTAQAKSLERQREIYAREGEAEFWDAAIKSAINGLYAAQIHGLNADHDWQLARIAEQSANALCATRYQARLQRWDEEHAPDLDAMMESGASKADLEAAITEATGRQAKFKGE